MTAEQRLNAPFSILMADDDHDDQMLLNDAFDDVCLKSPLVFVNDGQELLDYLKQRGKFSELEGQPQPGIILLDLNMPRMSGREALEQLKKDEELRKIPVIILTTSKREEDIQRSYQLGASSYIVKPVTFANMMAVAKSLSKYWMEIVTLTEMNRESYG